MLVESYCPTQHRIRFELPGEEERRGSIHPRKHRDDLETKGGKTEQGRRKTEERSRTLRSRFRNAFLAAVPEDFLHVTQSLESGVDLLHPDDDLVWRQAAAGPSTFAQISLEVLRAKKKKNFRPKIQVAERTALTLRARAP